LKKRTKYTGFSKRTVPSGGGKDYTTTPRGYENRGPKGKTKKKKQRGGI